MKDISDKVTTLRTALARSVLRVTDSTIATIKAGEIPKGDPLVIAKVAAVQAAKNTSMIIPYCHQIAIDYVGVEYELTKDSIVIDVTVKATHKTGVEMEAMTAASVAALTIYDMVKPLDDFAEIEKTILVSKKRRQVRLQIGCFDKRHRGSGAGPFRPGLKGRERRSLGQNYL